MSVTIPMVNAPYLNLQGMDLAYGTTTTLTVTSGRARNSSNINDITIDSTVTINAAVNGAAGLDTGSLGASTFYAVYAIGDSTKYNAGSALISADTSAPLLPSGYDMYRRIGYVLTDGSSHLLDFNQTGAGLDRTMWYAAAIQVLNAGTQSSFTSVDCSAATPAEVNVIFNAVITPTAASDTAAVRSSASSSVAGQVIISGVVAGEDQALQIVCPCDSAASVDYLVTGALTLDVAGYVDSLAS